jgi:SAM-dependent methyltransferase
MTAETPQGRKCPICLKPFVAYSMGEKNDYTLEACRACGSVMVQPWMTDEIREQYFGEIEPQITHSANPDGDITHRRKIIERVVAHPAGKTFLDVSSQNGYAVMAAKSLGMKAYGIDSHEFFAEFARNKFGEELFEQISAKDFADANPDKKFDMVYASEAFSLNTRPDELAEALSRLVAPNGVVYIEEPDGNHWNLPRKFTIWPVCFPPINFVYVSRKGLFALLKRHGLVVKKLFWSWHPFTKLVAKRKG